MTDLWVRQAALRTIARHFKITFVGASEQYGSALVPVQCNMVTAESVRAVLRQESAP
jgi:hypothetical protein